LKIAAARRLIDVGVYLVLPDARRAHGLDGAAQDGKRVVLGKKPDFDVRKFLSAANGPFFGAWMLQPLAVMTRITMQSTN
jgi:hypothetical protein